MNENLKCDFLVDTGASISLIKEDNCLNYDMTDNCRISGISTENLSTLGSTDLILATNEAEFLHKFQVVPSDFPILGKGILGLDFISRFDCILNYDGDPKMILRPTRSVQFEVPLSFSNQPNEIDFFVPARSEVMRKVEVKGFQKDELILVHNGEIARGVFVARTIISGDKPYVNILNTTNDDVSVKNPKLNVESLENYDVFAMNQNAENEKLILEKLSKRFPKFVEKKLKKLCEKYVKAFGLEGESLKPTSVLKQKLFLKDQMPVYSKNYKIPHAQKDEVNRQVSQLLKKGYIENSCSEYNSPILLVPKKSLPGEKERRWRLVVDFRKVNEKLMGDRYPLPKVSDILDSLGSAIYFCVLDLLSGFHQIELHKDSRDMTSFSTEKGSFRFTRLPFGLKVAPNGFQRMMNIAFSGLTPEKAFVYMDDLIVFASSEEKMLLNLKEVFATCIKHGLKLNPDKCDFFKHEVTYLGHKCTEEGILPDDSKYEKIKNYPEPKNKDEVKRFVAFVNFYRKFVPKFANYAVHLSRLTQKNAVFVWTEKCQESFEYLRNALLEPKILKYPNYEKEFCVTTDASDLACGAVLSQEYNGTQMPVAFASRKFLPGEKNKSVIERELAAIHWALTHFRPYLYGKKFLVKTDHRPLVYLFSMVNPSSKLTRMRLDLEEFDFVVEYVKGGDNVCADALSRIDFEDLKNMKTEIEKVLTVTTRSMSERRKNEKREIPIVAESKEIEVPRVYEVLRECEVKNVPKICFDLKNLVCKVILKKKQLFEMSLRNCVVNGRLCAKAALSSLEKMADNYKVKRMKMSSNDPIFECVGAQSLKDIGGQVLKEVQIALTPEVKIVTNEEEKLKIFEKYHNDPLQGGHCGFKRTYDKIRFNFVWNKMSKDVRSYVKQCKVCQMTKYGEKTREAMKLTDTPQQAFDVVCVDTVGPLPKSSTANEYLVTIVCELTKYLVIIPVNDKSAKTVAEAIVNEFVLTYGPMAKIITDKGREYDNDLFKELSILLKVEHAISAPYHHETVGLAERSHRTLNQYLRAYMNESRDDWPQLAKYFEFSYNTTPSVVHGYTPYELVYGKRPRDFSHLGTEVDPLYNVDNFAKEVKFRLQCARLRAKDLVEKSKMMNKVVFDKKLNPLAVVIGDKVLVKNFGHKLDCTFKGPFTVLEIEEENLALNEKGKKIIVHKNNCKKFIE